jgi:hypothetical protein
MDASAMSVCILAVHAEAPLQFTNRRVGGERTRRARALMMQTCLTMIRSEQLEPVSKKPPNSGLVLTRGLLRAPRAAQAHVRWAKTA